MSFVDHLLGCAFTIGFRGSGLARSAGQVAAVFGKLAGVGACAQATCCQGERKQVMAEPKVVGKVSDAAAPASAVQAVEQVKVREAEAEVKVKEEEEEGECSVDELLDQHQELLDGMLSEGYLDDQFSQLQMLQDESSPDFVEEVVTLFFDDTEKLLENLTESLKTDPVDFKVVDGHVHQFKGSSSSIGAQRVKNVCVAFRHCCDAEDKKGCVDHLAKVKEEFNDVRSKLRKMLELEKRIMAAGGVLPFVEC